MRREDTKANPSGVHPVDMQAIACEGEYGAEADLDALLGMSLPYEMVAASGDTV